MSSIPKPPDQAPGGASDSQSKSLVIILVVVGLAMCGCVGLPVLGGFGMALYWASASPPEPQMDFGAGPGAAIPPGFGTDQEMAFPGAGGGLPSGDFEKEAARQRMLAAEQNLNAVRAQYEAMQAVYEQQRNFNAQQAGRLGAQGIRPPAAIPPDPQLQLNVQAAEAEFEAAKAAYEALP